jgi:predicted TIM-barrel fold metal-dependent hydrolase
VIRIASSKPPEPEEVTMPMIDADAHVIENDATWEYMLESERRFKPQLVRTGEAESSIDCLLIDGKLIPWTNIGKDVPKASREMTDLGARIAHMNDLGIDIQVIYPTIFIFPFTRRPEVDLAICRSYNRWMADVVKNTLNRFRWVMAPPLLSMDKAIAELRFGKENGACGVFMRGLEADRSLSDSYFTPFYEEASRLDLPICIHSGNGSLTAYELFLDDPGFCKFKLAVIGAFHSLVYFGIPQKFPKLKIGIIEVGAQWLPYAIRDLARRYARRGKSLEKNLLAENHIYITCQNDDDIPYILKCAGADNLIMGTDYGHSDNASELLALRSLGGKGELGSAIVDKILYDNPKSFYEL